MIGVRTVQNLYMVANPRSCEGYAKFFLDKYPHYTRHQIEVGVVRRAGVAQFVLPTDLEEH
mgnify:CR=1 FL=1